MQTAQAFCLRIALAIFAIAHHCSAQSCGPCKYYNEGSSGCSDCPADTYKSGTNGETECLDQKTCGVGEFLFGASCSAKGACKPCSTNEYQNLESHRASDCKDQPFCSAGQYLSGGDSSSSEGTCKDCAVFVKYQDAESHQLGFCNNQETCGRGEYLDGASTTTKGNCQTCKGGEYQDSELHRTARCPVQPTCSKGELYYLSIKDALARTVKRSCIPCPPSTYQDQQKHKEEECKQHNVECNAGTFLQGSTTTSKGECNACPEGSYIQSDGPHQRTECDAQVLCGAGELWSGDSASEGTCTACDALQYQPSEPHRTTVCIDQDACSKSKFYIDSQVAVRTCGDCAPDTYQDLALHFEAQCAAQPDCGVGMRYIAHQDQERECLPCLADSYIESASHKVTSCMPQPECTAGNYYTDSQTALRSCTACDPNTYLADDDDAHRVIACTEQPTCDDSNYYTDSQTSLRVCTSCEANTYMADDDHTNPECIAQETCSAGTRYVDHQDQARECPACLAKTYTTAASHRAVSCEHQDTCGAGTAYVDSLTATRSCKPCDDGTYLASSAHRTTTCKNHKTCGHGQRLAGASEKSAGVCKACAAGTYQDKSEHQEPDCIAQKKCGPGLYFDGNAAEEGTCKPCADGTYLKSAAHRTTTCKDHLYCGESQRLVGASNISAGVCKACAAGTYQDESKHQEPDCIAQKKCGPGSYFEGNPAEEGACKPCADGTYLKSAAHRIDTCKDQVWCSEGLYIADLSSATSGICKACPDFQYIDSDHHRLSECEAQIECPAGEKISSTDTRALATCLSCESGTFRAEEKHRESSCEPWLECSSDQVEVVAATSTANSICESQTGECSPSTQYESLAPTQTSFRQCSALSTCIPGQYIESEHTATTDRTCNDCSQDTFQPNKNQDSCMNVTTCGAGEHVSVPATKESDLECLPCKSGTFQTREAHRLYACDVQPVCIEEEEYETDAATSTSARLCAGLTTCIAGQHISSNHTATVDRKCSQCAHDAVQPEEDQYACIVLTTTISTTTNTVSSTTTTTSSTTTTLTSTSTTATVSSTTTTVSSTTTTFTSTSITATVSSTTMTISSTTTTLTSTSTSTTATVSSTTTTTSTTSLSSTTTTATSSSTTASITTTTTVSSTTTPARSTTNVVSFTTTTTTTTTTSRSRSNHTTSMSSTTNLADMLAVDLKRLGYSVDDLHSVGFTIAELLVGGYTRDQITQGGWSAAELRSAGFAIAELLVGGYTRDQIIQGGWSAAELRSDGFTIEELLTAFSIQDLYAAGFEQKTNEKIPWAGHPINSTELVYTVQEIYERVRIYNAPCKDFGCKDNGGCPSGHFWSTTAFQGLGGCYPCPSGSYANTTDSNFTRIGDEYYKCPYACAPGYISDPGSNSSKTCRIGYEVRDMRFDDNGDPRTDVNALFHFMAASCGGKEVIPSGPGSVQNSWPSKGFEYITTREECELAAGLLVDAPGRKLTESSITDPCPGFPNQDHTRKCSRKNTELSAQAPMGYCGVERDKTGRKKQRLVFYNNDTQPAFFYTGATLNYEFLAICKIKLCNFLEEIEDSGATLMRDRDNKMLFPKGPEEIHNAKCMPNPIQFGLWETAEDDAYEAFYIAAGAIVPSVLIAMFLYLRFGADPDDYTIILVFKGACKEDFFQEHGHAAAAALKQKTSNLVVSYSPTLESKPRRFSSWKSETPKTDGEKVHVIRLKDILHARPAILNVVQEGDQTKSKEVTVEIVFARRVKVASIDSTRENLRKAIDNATTKTPTIDVIVEMQPKTSKKLTLLRLTKDKGIYANLYDRKANSWPETKTSAFEAVMLAMRSFDLMSDWAFFKLAIDTPRFKYIVTNQGLSFRTFNKLALAFNISSSALWLPDMVSFYFRDHAAKLHPRNRAPLTSDIITLAVLLAEDVPQFALNIRYMILINNEKYGDPVLDPIALASLAFTLIGLFFNLSLIYNGFWRDTRDSAGQLVPRAHGLGAWIKDICFPKDEDTGEHGKFGLFRQRATSAVHEIVINRDTGEQESREIRIRASTAVRVNEDRYSGPTRLVSDNVEIAVSGKSSWVERPDHWFNTTSGEKKYKDDPEEPPRRIINRMSSTFSDFGLGLDDAKPLNFRPRSETRWDASSAKNVRPVNVRNQNQGGVAGAPTRARSSTLWNEPAAKEASTISSFDDEEDDLQDGMNGYLGTNDSDDDDHSGPAYMLAASTRSTVDESSL